MPDVFIKLPDPRVKERTALPIVAYFRDSSDAADTSTTVDYRIDCLTTRTILADWTSVTPGTSVTITVTPTENKIVNHTNNLERRQITVSSDRTLSTETRDTAIWLVENIHGYDD